MSLIINGLLITNQTNDDQYNEIKENKKLRLLNDIGYPWSKDTTQTYNISSVMSNMYNEIKENNESKGA